MYLTHLKNESPTALNIGHILGMINNAYEYTSCRLGIKLGKIKKDYVSDFMLVNYTPFTEMNTPEDTSPNTAAEAAVSPSFLTKLFFMIFTSKTPYFKALVFRNLSGAFFFFSLQVIFSKINMKELCINWTKIVKNVSNSCELLFISL